MAYRVYMANELRWRHPQWENLAFKPGDRVVAFKRDQPPLTPRDNIMSLFIPGVIDYVNEDKRSFREYSVLFLHTGPDGRTRFEKRICPAHELELERRVVEGSTEGWERVPSSDAWVQLKLPKSEIARRAAAAQSSGSESGSSSSAPSTPTSASGYPSSPSYSMPSSATSSTTSFSSTWDPPLKPLTPRWVRTLVGKRRGDTIYLEGESKPRPIVIEHDWRKINASEVDMIRRGELEMRYDIEKRMMYLRAMKKVRFGGQVEFDTNPVPPRY
ncbi:hypothetical protein BOTBODRAFT_27713 [Botryobasidium botryosum FD-172 SS1]|uniref:Uncharacterized protein n=1 Tax=Botryobasidium botryosum (strain FD-172 SS1) TaxID=930990 RepID=A0A067N951_BOTB1|nr:hypothetical protein BOTBODRAFT_27713 [Botryobasidium botryosum FD-172 SS1]